LDIGFAGEYRKLGACVKLILTRGSSCDSKQ
jgi:hypothetical protein